MSISTRTGVLAAAREHAARRLDAVELGHADVHQHDVGLQRAAPASTASSAVGGLADDVEVVLGVEDHAEAGAHQRLVVGDQHADGSCGLHRLVSATSGSRRADREAAAVAPVRPRARRRTGARARASRPGRGRRRRRRRVRAPGPRSAISSSSARSRPAHAHVGRRGAGVLERVRQRLLHDAVGGEVERRRAAGAARRRRCSATGSPAARARSTSAPSSRMRRLRRARRRPRRRRRSTPSSRRISASASRPVRSICAAASIGARGIAVEDPPRAAGLHDHHADASARRRRASRARSGAAPRRPRGASSRLVRLLGARSAASCSSSVSRVRVRTLRPVSQAITANAVGKKKSPPSLARRSSRRPRACRRRCTASTAGTRARRRCSAPSE